MWQCLGAIDKMIPVQHPHLPTSAGLKRRSSGDQGDNLAKRQAAVPPIEPAIPPRVIQPRPPPNGFSSKGFFSSGPAVTATGKKRGRPSKADKEAQARASWTRPEYHRITPAPTGLMPTLAPQRDFVSSPGYDITSSSSSSVDQKARLRGIPNTSDMSPDGGARSLASPALTTPHAMPEQVEHLGRATLSPRDRVLLPPDSRSPHLPGQPQSHPIPPQQGPATIHQQPRHGPPYELLRASEPPQVNDPIFPGRDRSRSASGQLATTTPPHAPPPLPLTAGSPVTNRN
jgi:hypothetical protein